MCGAKPPRLARHPGSDRDILMVIMSLVEALFSVFWRRRFLRSAPIDPRRHGYLPLRHAASPSLGRSVADIPVGSRSQGEVPVSPLRGGDSFVSGQFFGKAGSGFCSSVSRNNLNSLRDAAGGFPSFASFLALRINWRNVCTLISGLCSRNSDKSWSSPSTNRSLQASI